MPNTPYAGSALYLAWIYSGGTVELDTYFRNFTWSRDLNFIDATAGADTFETLLDSYGTGGDFSVTHVGQADDALLTPLAYKTAGTVRYGPEGNESGKVKYDIPATSKGPSFNQPYNDVNEITFSWRQTAAESKGTF